MSANSCTVVNLTAAALTVNGVALAPGEWLYPVNGAALQVARSPSIRFYNPATGAYYDWAGEGYWYNDALVATGATGADTILVVPPDYMPAEPAEPPAEPLVYADMAGGASEGLPLCGASGKPLYAAPAMNLADLRLFAWWDFSEADGAGWVEWREYSHGVRVEWAYPNALINGKTVCPGHVTGHIVPYAVAPAARNVYGASTLSFDFTMSLVPPSGLPGGAVTCRVWGGDGATAEPSSFAATPAAHRAEAAAVPAAFRVTIDTSVTPYTWTVEAA